jgi:hypothetical protein
MGLCKFCGRDNPLIEAHIIPESMYPFDKGSRHPLLKVPTSPDIPLGKSRAGEYDPELICACCEAKSVLRMTRFGYSVRSLGQRTTKTLKRVLYELKTYNYANSNSSLRRYCGVLRRLQDFFIKR